MDPAMSPKWMQFLQSDNTIDVISHQRVWDYEDFFGPVTKPYNDAAFFVNNDTKRISEILLALGLASTRTWCRKNNWDWEIPQGYFEVKFGLKRIKLCILVSDRISLISLPEPHTVEEIDEQAYLEMVGLK